MKSIMIFLAIAIQGAGVFAATKSVCNVDGEFGQFAGATQKRLTIDGTKAVITIVESKGINDRLDDKGRKVIGRDKYTVVSTMPTQDMMHIDLLDANGRTAYMGFFYDCKKRSLDHASLGEFPRISMTGSRKAQAR